MPITLSRGKHVKLIKNESRYLYQMMNYHTTIGSSSITSKLNVLYRSSYQLCPEVGQLFAWLLALGGGVDPATM